MFMWEYIPQKTFWMNFCQQAALISDTIEITIWSIETCRCIVQCNGQGPEDASTSDHATLEYVRNLQQTNMIYLCV